MHKTEESVVRMDMDIAWPSKMSILVQLYVFGNARLCIPIEVCDFKILGCTRVELTNFMPIYPGFRCQS